MPKVFTIIMLSLFVVIGCFPFNAHGQGAFKFFGTIVECGDSVRTVRGDDPAVGNGHTADEICTVGGCTTCDLLSSAMKLLDFIILLGTVVASLLFVNAGYLYLTAGGSPGSISKAHGIFFSTLVGLVITLGAYLFIDTIMKVIYGGEGWGPWNELVCTGGSSDGVTCVKVRSTLATDQPAQIVTTDTGAKQLRKDGTMVGFPAEPTGKGAAPINMKDSSQTVPAGVAPQLNTVAKQLFDFFEESGPSTIIVTEGYPPSRSHGDSCHTNGTCVDIVWKGQDKEILSLAARDSGGQAVYETNDISEYNSLKSRYEKAGLPVAPPGTCTGSTPRATLCYLPSCNGSNTGACVTGAHYSYYSIPKNK